MSLTTPRNCITDSERTLYRGSGNQEIWREVSSEVFLNLSVNTAADKCQLFVCIAQSVVCPAIAGLRLIAGLNISATGALLPILLCADPSESRLTREAAFGQNGFFSALAV